MRPNALLLALLLTPPAHAAHQLSGPAHSDAAQPTAQPTSTQTAPQTPDPASASPQAQLQTLLAAQQSAVAANDPAQIVSTSKPAAALALRLAGTLDLAADHLSDARSLLTRSASLDPQPATIVVLLTADLRASDSAAAEADSAALLELTGETAPAHLLLAQTFQAADDLPRTIAQLQRALALDPKLPSLHLALGTAYWQLNEFQYNPDSLREFTLAQQADPAGFLANLNLAWLLSQYHRFPEAAQYLNLAAAADPASPDASFQLGINFFSEGDYAAARPALERAVELTGADLAHNSFQIRRALTALSRIAALDGRPDAARRYDAQAEDLHQKLLASGYAPALTESALLVGAGGSHPARSASAEKPQQPSSVSSRPELGAGEGPPSAPTQSPTPPIPNPLRQQLLTIAASALNDAGAALARTRDYAAALPLFREAAATDPTLPPVLRNLGLAAFHTNNLPEARQALTRALRIDPNDTLARRYLDQIP